MKDLNQATLTGRLTADPVVSKVGDGISCIRATLAVSKNGKQEGANFLPVTFWRHTADFVGQYVHKGDRLLVTGAFVSNNYEKDGKMNYSYTVNVDDVILLGRAKGSGAADDGGETPVVDLDEEDELPY